MNIKTLKKTIPKKEETNKTVNQRHIIQWLEKARLEKDRQCTKNGYYKRC